MNYMYGNKKVAFFLKSTYAFSKSILKVRKNNILSFKNRLKVQKYCVKRKLLQILVNIATVNISAQFVFENATFSHFYITLEIIYIDHVIFININSFKLV